MTRKAFQHYNDEDLSHCYGCGRLNKQGLQIIKPVQQEMSLQ